jgi:hypothetical protein
VRESKKKADEKKDRPQLKCFNCGKIGHPAFICKENGGLSGKEVHDVLKRTIIH